jgi:hypothetical protein
MLIYLRKRTKAQSTAEYVMLIALAIAAINVVSGYVKKSIAGKIKWAMDGYCDPNNHFEGEQKIYKANVGTENVAQKAGLQKDDKGDGGVWKVDESSDESVRAGIIGDLEEVRTEVERFSVTDPNKSPWGDRFSQLPDKVADNMDELTGEGGREYKRF